MNDSDARRAPGGPNLQPGGHGGGGASGSSRRAGGAGTQHGNLRRDMSDFLVSHHRHHGVGGAAGRAKDADGEIRERGAAHCRVTRRRMYTGFEPGLRGRARGEV